MSEGSIHRKVSMAGIWLGIGMGGLVDGIVLHQILQWHDMVSNWIPPTTMATMKISMVWDGIFHTFVWLITAIGIGLLWRAAYRHEAVPPLRAFAGQLLLGWGGFNLIEGVVDHQILGVHSCTARIRLYGL